MQSFCFPNTTFFAKFQRGPAYGVLLFLVPYVCVPSVTTSTSDHTCEVYVDRMQQAEMAHMSTVNSTVSKSMQHLRNTFRHVDGLEDVGYGQSVCGRSLPRFKSATRPFVQVLNIGDHWVCATNAFSNNKNQIFWYDSLHGTVSYQSVV